MVFCGLCRRKRVKKHNPQEKSTWSYEKASSNQPAQGGNPTFSAHQQQQPAPRPVIDTRHSNFSQASTLDIPSSPPPLYQPQSYYDPFVPLNKKQSPFGGISETPLLGGPYQRPGASVASNNRLTPIPSPSLRQKLASRPHSFDDSTRPASMRPTATAVVDIVARDSRSTSVSNESTASSSTPQPSNNSSESIGRVSPAPPIPRVSSKRVRPHSLPVTARGVPVYAHQPPSNITRKPISPPPSIPPLPLFADIGSLRVASQCGLRRSDTVASRYDEPIDEEDDDEWTPMVPALNVDAYLGLVGESPYAEHFSLPERVEQSTNTLPIRTRTYRRGCSSSRIKARALNAPDRAQGNGFGGESSISKERELEESFALLETETSRERQLNRPTDVLEANDVSGAAMAGGTTPGRAAAEKRWSLKESQIGNPMGLPSPVHNIEDAAPAPLRIIRSNGLVVDVPLLKQAPLPPTKQERQARGKIVQFGGRRL